ncbi:hypothetical protein PMZ80_006060 [Knufia obscura]|uniref:Uncharacterized protein n=2 Tax=Knufia TaxID=430999 RepID=A0AAN8EIF3_9EURO|nr:hypothetical protein PMZ80_006060 [Knufia obscura]KAK5954730.1 hypothetical protein OHC33_004454 [Knufia fluminis]
MATAPSEPKKPSAGPSFYPQLSGWLSALNKAPPTHAEASQPSINVVPPSASNASGTSSPPAAALPFDQILSQANSQQAFNLPSGVLSREAVAREALNLAVQTLPQDEEPPKGKAKAKSRIRRLLLSKFVLKMLLGRTLADWVYPWIHPKARPGQSTM